MPEPAKARETLILRVIINPMAEQIVNKEPFRISKGNNDQVLWVTDPPGGQFTVEFQPESPFYESQFSDAAPYSGLVRRNVLADPNKEYKYTVRVAGRTVDPVGIVDA